MAKKRVGLAAFDKEITDARFRTFGTDLLKTQAEQLSSQLETFQQALAAFSSTHGREIRASPEFRDQFNHMCATIGINPLSQTKESSIWSRLGLNDLYHDLAVQVIETCRRTKAENGGLIKVQDLNDAINARARKFGSVEVTPNEVIKAVQSLKILESGIQVISIGEVQMIRSVPSDLSTDQSTVLESAEIMGFVSESMIRLNLRWERERVRQVLEELLGNGMVWIDTQGLEKEYWVPSSMRSQ